MSLQMEPLLLGIYLGQLQMTLWRAGLAFWTDNRQETKVTAIILAQEAVITFMEKAALQFKAGQTFRWLRRKDECATAAEFVFAKNIVLEPSSFIAASTEKMTPKQAAFKAMPTAAV